MEYRNPKFLGRGSKARLFSELKAQGDTRLSGQGDVFDRYEHANKAQAGLYEKFMRGEKPKAGWVNESDFEPLLLRQ